MATDYHRKNRVNIKELLPKKHPGIDIFAEDVYQIFKK